MNVDNFGRREFTPLPAGGGAAVGESGSSGSTCCCEVAPVVDALLSDGIITTAIREACKRLQPISWDHANGIITLTLPAPSSMQLEKMDGGDDFTWQPDDPVPYLSAIYSDDSSATENLSNQSLVVTFVHRKSGIEYGCDCDVMEMKISTNADLSPQPENEEEETP